MQDLGFNTVRFDLFWAWFEPRPGVYNQQAFAQLDALVRDARESLVQRFLFAIGQREGQTSVVLRVRPSKQALPQLVLDAQPFARYLKLDNLFLPVGAKLHPILRRDAVRKLLAEDTTRITWLQPDPDKPRSFSPESLPEDAFRRDVVLAQAVERHVRHGVQRITCIDGLRCTPYRPHRRSSAPQPIAVFDVVVNQREVVQQFDGGGGGQGGVPVAAGGFAAEQCQYRADALAGIKLRGFEVCIGPAQVIMQHAEECGQRRIIGGGDGAAHFGFDGGEESGEVFLEVRSLRLKIGRTNA